VPVVVRMGIGSRVPPMLVRRFVVLVCHVVHLNYSISHRGGQKHQHPDHGEEYFDY